MKIPVIYWTGTGNTETMANAIAEGINENGNEAAVMAVSEASTADVEAATALALGCAAMGDEVLEEDEMEPFVTSIEGLVKGKKLVLFGSYDWGDGQWMRDWEERMKGCGAEVVKTVIANLEPDDDGLAECKAAGKTL